MVSPDSIRANLRGIAGSVLAADQVGHVRKGPQESQGAPLGITDHGPVIDVGTGERFALA
jgi:hypothetical protein